MAELFKKVMSILFPNPLKDFDKEGFVQDKVNLINSYFEKKHGNIPNIESVKVIGGGDYSEEYFDLIKKLINEEIFIKDSYEARVSWNKPHLYFDLVLSKNSEMHVIAFLYNVGEVDIIWDVKLRADINIEFKTKLLSQKDIVG